MHARLQSTLTQAHIPPIALELSVWLPQGSEYVSAQNKRRDCAELSSIWHHFCSSKTAMASLMEPPELHSALNNATTAFPRV